MASMLNNTNGFILFLTDILGWSRDEVLVYEAHVRRMLRSTRYHGYVNARVIYARKPLSKVEA